MHDVFQGYRKKIKLDLVLTPGAHQNVTNTNEEHTGHPLLNIREIMKTTS